MELTFALVDIRTAKVVATAPDVDTLYALKADEPDGRWLEIRGPL